MPALADLTLLSLSVGDTVQFDLQNRSPFWASSYGVIKAITIDAGRQVMTLTIDLGGYATEQVLTWGSGWIGWYYPPETYDP